MSDEIETTFVYRPSALPAPLQQEFALMGAVVVQLEQLSEGSRQRVLGYLNALYGLTKPH